jgi:hypothetical protein
MIIKLLFFIDFNENSFEKIALIGSFPYFLNQINHESVYLERKRFFFKRNNRKLNQKKSFLDIFPLYVFLFFGNPVFLFVLQLITLLFLYLFFLFKFTNFAFLNF